MSRENIKLVAVSLRVKVASQVIEEHSVASPYIVGEELARQIAAYVQKNHIGYYPALDFFHESNEVEKDLLDAVESISWLVSSLVRDEIQVRLRTVFSELRFESIQCVAYTLPTVRPGTRNALHELALHYTPDRVRINLVAAPKPEQESDPEIAISLAKTQICRWLKDRFSSFEVTSINYLDKPTTS